MYSPGRKFHLLTAEAFDILAQSRFKRWSPQMYAAMQLVFCRGMSIPDAASLCEVDYHDAWHVARRMREKVLECQRVAAGVAVDVDLSAINRGKRPKAGKTDAEGGGGV